MRPRYIWILTTGDNLELPRADAEQRIFLAAMSREKEVCKEVDYQLSDVREPYEHTLVSVCKEIERKVKAALWKN